MKLAVSENIIRRFGGPFATEVILTEGEGGGYFSVPSVLLDYQHVLGLSIEETWFLIGLMRYNWNGNTVYPNMTRMCKKAGIHKRVLWGEKGRNKEGVINSLKRKGFIKVVQDEGEVKYEEDRRVRYDINMLYQALAYCIYAYPGNKLFKIKSVEEVIKWASSNGVILNWEELEKLQQDEEYS